ncbi:hypothetical protein [Deinococcus depolymerans]
MRFRRAPHPPTVPPVGRWVLALLTVIASLMHLTRSPGVGGLGLDRPGATRVHAPRPVTVTTPAVGHPPGHGAHRTPHDRPGHAAPATHAPGLSDAAPNAPPHPGKHAAPHCPLCLTAGFALNPAPAALPLPLTARMAAAAVRPTGPATAAVRHADPRAPPHPRA